MKLIVTCGSGTEASVKRELEKLGVVNPKAIDGKIEVEGDFELLSRLSVWLRCGDRILIELGKFKATTFDELFDGISKIDWETWVTADNQIRLNGNCFNSKLMAIKTSGSIVKKAIMKRLQKVYKTELLEVGETITVYFNITKDICTVMLDASGDGLHKRGYRTLNHTAPIKETLAASLIDLSIMRGDKPFADVFCGSGTIAIETALIARNIAPGIRRNFDFEKFKNYPEGTLEKVKAEAKKEERDIKPNIYACDINAEAIRLAKIHAKAARVDEYITFEVADMKDFVPKDDYGVIISNPPYGDRLGDKDDVEKLYKSFAEMVKKYPTWSTYLITDDKEFEKKMGKPATKKRKLYNAKIECIYYSFMGEKPPRKEN